MNSEYREKRESILKVFNSYIEIEDSETEFVSPSGLYKLRTSRYGKGKDVVSWNYSRGIISNIKTSRTIAGVKRNYGHFWHSWVEHPNGNEYLLCGEDYQGYSVINLTKEIYQVYFPKEGHQGVGFCWAKVFPSPDKLVLAVDGCYWACPYEIVFYDFRNPEKLPFDELGRIDTLSESYGWLDNETFSLSQEIEFRKSDGVFYKDLSEEEQQILDSNPDLYDYKSINVEAKRPPFKNLDE